MPAFAECVSYMRHNSKFPGIKICSTDQGFIAFSEEQMHHLFGTLKLFKTHTFGGRDMTKVNVSLFSNGSGKKVKILHTHDNVGDFDVLERVEAQPACLIFPRAISFVPILKHYLKGDRYEAFWGGPISILYNRSRDTPPPGSYGLLRGIGGYWKRETRGWCSKKSFTCGEEEIYTLVFVTEGNGSFDREIVKSKNKMLTLENTYHLPLGVNHKPRPPKTSYIERCAQTAKGTEKLQ